MSDEKRREITELPVERIDQFPKHPYKVKDDDDMIQLVDSIRDNGVIVPIIVRPKPGDRYEMISGHRRLQACKYLGHKTIRAQVLEMDRNAATVMMVDSNLARSHILPSEKAFAYRMRLEAMKRQGKRNDLTSSPLDTKLIGRRSDVELAKSVGESKDTIHRYIRLTYLIPMLLKLVDDGDIAMRPAVEISYLSEELQNVLADSIACEACTPSHWQAIRMKNMYNEGTLTADAIYEIMREAKPNQKEQFRINMSTVQKYIPKNLSKAKSEAYIVEALKHYDKYLKRKSESSK